MRRDVNRGAVFTRRVLLAGGVQTLLLGGLAARLRQVQVEEGSRYTTMAEDNRVTARMMAPQRGRILDRFGHVLAGSLINWRALLVTEQTANFRRTLDNLSTIVPLTDAERARIDRDVRHGKSYIPVLIKEYLSREAMTKIEVNAPDLPGILVDGGTSRTYNYPYELAHILGYVAPPSESDMNGDALMALPGVKVGRSGVEKFHDLTLRGRPGVVHLEVNAVGRVIRELDRTDGVNGDDVSLTFDLSLQQAIQKRLGDEAASAVVLDCRNGEVMAMVSNPSYDPTLFSTGVSQAQWRDWTKDRRTPLINKATSGLYAPGSTFKMAVALAGLDAKTIGYHDRLSCPGHLDLGGSRFHCWAKGGHGALDLKNALKYSCDVYFYQVALRTGIDRISAMSHRLGLGIELDIDIPGQRVGQVPTKDWRISKGHPWQLGDTVVSGIGQGYVVNTPLQLAVYAARIASGRAVQPHFTRRIAGVLQPGYQPEDWPDLGVPEPMLQAVRGGMFAVVNEGGTAPRARLAGNVHMAGKTGSSQVRRVSRKQRESGYDSKSLPWEFRPHALFVAYAPYEQPRYALSVVVEHGNAGAATAAPMAKDIMTEVLRRDPAARQDDGPARLADAKR
ncbi:MAG: penicillin-binding protein 2 [Acetobacteraceae bacterium]|nr:penicillin-binding protein 2 [Acetobacteraceae bacterium]